MPLKHIFHPEKGYIIAEDAEDIAVTDGLIIDSQGVITQHSGGNVVSQLNSKTMAALLALIGDQIAPQDSEAMSYHQGTTADHRAFFAGKTLIDNNGTTQIFDDAGSAISGFTTKLVWEGDHSLQIMKTTASCDTFGAFKCSGGQFTVGTGSNQNSKSFIQIYMTASAAGGAPAGGASIGINGNPDAGSVFLYTDGSDLFIKLANGGNKRLNTTLLG